MAYANMVLAHGGAAEFARLAAAAGAAGAIVPDLPLGEAEEVREEFAAAGLAMVPLVAPTTPPARRAEICAVARGFVYVVSTVGTTGERAAVPAALAELVADDKADAEHAGRGRLRDRHRRPGGRGRRDRRRGDHRQPPGPRRRRGRLAAGGAPTRSPASSARHASPSPDERISCRPMGMVVTLFLAIAAMTVSYALGQGGPVAGMVFFAVLLIGGSVRVLSPR